MGFADFECLTFYRKNCRVHYWMRAGTSDKCVLLLHGAGCDHMMFERQADIFDPSYSVIAWDARAHGLSAMENGQRFSFEDMYADCLTLLERHGVRQAAAVGQSMGGNLAQCLARRCPERVERLVLIDCTRNTQKLTLAEKLTLKAAPFIFRVYPWGMFVRQSARACGVTPSVRAYVAGRLRQMGRDAFVDVMLATLACLNADGDCQLTQPTLLICGAKDITGNIRTLMPRWARQSGCPFCIVPNAAHNANMDNPQAVNSRILSFVAEGT